MTGGVEEGVLLVDKPAGKTSFAMVRAVRRVVNIKKVGHAGTLDPFATGLLVVCIGRPATRLISSLMVGEKEYLATMELGWLSTTQDPEGELSPGGAPVAATETDIDQTLERFRGISMQRVPAFSALKHKGKPLYHYARRGVVIEKQPREIEIKTLQWLDRRALVTPEQPLLTLRIRCGKGTYIRQLAADIGDILGCGAYLRSLRRLRSGCFSVDESLAGLSLCTDGALEQVQNNILSVDHVRKLLQYFDEEDNVPC